MPQVTFDKPPETRRESNERRVRQAIGGHQQAAILRIILWVLAFCLLAGGAPLWIVILPFALLCVTDGLV